MSETYIPLGRTGGVITGAVLVLLLLWGRADTGLGEGLARIGLNLKSDLDTGLSALTPIGLPRKIWGVVHGVGETDHAQRRFFARAGQELVLEYEIEVRAGSIGLGLYRTPFYTDPLWEASLSGSRAELVRVLIYKTGFYEVSMQRHDHAGSYLLGWQLE